MHRATRNRFATVAAAVLVVAVMAFGGAASQAQVLSQVPADALAVLKVNNLKATSDKVAVLAQQWGLSQAVPQFGDPLGALKQQMNIAAGLDEAGEMAFVFIDPAIAGSKDNAMLALLPVSDYKAFIGNFTDAKDLKDGITQATAGAQNKTIFIANWGKYAAVTPAQVVLAKKPAGLKLTGAAAKEMETKDACIYANMPALKAKYLPKLKANREKWIAQVEAEVTKSQNPNAAKFSPVVKAAVGRAIDLAEGFLTDANSATYGFALSDKGIGTTAMLDFLPNTYMAKATAKMQNTDGSLLAGLPPTKYLFFGGSQQDPKVTSQMLNDLIAPIEKELKAGGDDMKPFIRYIDALRTAISSATGQTAGMFAPTGALGADSLFQFVAITTGDAAKIKVSQKEMLDAQQEVLKTLAPGGAAEQMKTSYTPNAKTISEVKFDQYQTQFNMNPQTPQEQQAAQLMTFLYGPNGLIMYTGQLDAKHVLTISGAKDEVITETIASAKKGEDALSALAPVQTVKSELPKKRMLEAYVPVDTILTTGIGYAKQFGMPVNLQLPADLPPLGMTVGTEGTVIRADGYVPTQLVQSIVSSIMQMMMEMRGGGGGGAAPGAPGGL